MNTSNKKLISKTLAARMMRCIEEYEAVKRRESSRFKMVKEFCKFYTFSHQNFMKIYHRYKGNPCEESPSTPEARSAIQYEKDGLGHRGGSPAAAETWEQPV